MVPSAARVACIAGGACTSLDQNSNKLVDIKIRTVRTLILTNSNTASNCFRNNVIPWVGCKDMYWYQIHVPYV